MSPVRLSEPIFQMCSERSGSNLMTKMFDAHPELVAPSPAHLFRVFADLAWRYEGQADALRGDLLAMFDAKVGAWLIDDLSPRDREAIVEPQASAAGMIAALLEAERERAGKRHFYLKENNIYDFLPFLESVSDSPRYLFLVRDPRDMALSWQKAAVKRGGIVRAAKCWLKDQTGFVRTITWLKGSRRIARLTYEDLIAAPEATLRRVCGDLELPFHPAMLEFSERSRSAQRDSERASAWENLSQPILAANSNKFLDGLTDDQLAYIEALCGPLMERLGYRKARPETAPPFGSHDSFDALERTLTAEEPWEKPNYPKLPREERERFERWSALHAKLTRRAP